MAVTLSPLAGAGWQFFDNNGVPLAGGLLYSYEAGTSTPLATYTSIVGNVSNSNPIVLDSAGRVPNEIWITTGYGYKFVLQTAASVSIATWDNIPSNAPSSFANDASSIAYEQGYTVNAGSFIVGESYLITSVGTTNFVAIGAATNTVGVYFTATGVGSGTGTANLSRTVQAKLQESVSVKDFGAIGDGVADDTLAITNAFANGGHVVFPTGTYKVTTVLTQNINNLTIDARSAIFNSPYGNVFAFKQCSDFSWIGGVINGGPIANPAYTNTPESIAQGFLIFNANRASILDLVVVNNSSNKSPCVTVWNMGQVQVNNNQLYYGGDNTIWVFTSSHVTASNNLILNSTGGRGICFQQVHRGAMTGNVVAEGKGDGLNVHGSDNVVITGNSVYNMVGDTGGIGLSSGVGIEWDENATPTTVAAAVADTQLYNGVFSRNITVSGNTFSAIEFGVRVGNNIGITGSNYGNQGQVVIDGNNIFGVATGITTGTSRQIRISNNMISTCNLDCIEISMAADTGGYTAQDIYIANNRFSQFNISLLSYNAIQFQSGTPVITQQFVITDNEWDNGNGGAGLCNIALSIYGLNARNNSYAAGTTTPVLSNQVAPFNYQPQFSDQTGANALAGMFITGASTDFTQTGAVGDTFTTVFTMPSNSTVAAQIQIGNGDRLVCWGTIYAQNGNSPSLTFTGTGGATYVQMSGSNIQIKGYTSGGTASYGGYYSIKYSLLQPA